MIMVAGFHFDDLVDFTDLDDQIVAMTLKCGRDMQITIKLV